MADFIKGSGDLGRLIDGLLVSVGTAILLISAMLWCGCAPAIRCKGLIWASSGGSYGLVQRLPHEGPLDFGYARREPNRLKPSARSRHYAQLRYGTGSTPP